MKEIVVISGKGGTGKTSLTGSLAVVAERSIVADCDVDAADLHLLLKPNLIYRESFMSGHEAVIDEESCASCGLCEEICRFDAIEFQDGRYRVRDIGCEGCKVCVEFCPEKAIDFPVSNCGEWYRSETAAGEMIHARLRAGAENSGKLVSLVRAEAQKCAEKGGSDWIIVDGPPGIGCPVISSVSGAAAAVIVTEPTLSGKHDLERVFKLTKHFGVTPFIVINKWDLNCRISGEIEEFACENGVPVAGKLPYSPLFNQAQQAGQPLVSFAPESDESGEVRSIWQGIAEVLGDR